MAMVKVNARDLIFEASDMQTPTPVWTEVGGLRTAGVNFAENEEVEDTTDFDSAGNYSQEVMQRGAKLNLQGQVLADDTTGAREPGQQQMNLHATQVGAQSQVDVRFRYPGETNWIKWEATISRGEEAGGTNNKVGFSYDIVRCGAPSLVPVV